MDKIKNIKYSNQYIKIESSNNYIYKIPNNNSYVRNLLYKGIKVNKEVEKDIKYYNKCADICIYPIWMSAAFLAYAFITDFILLDFILVVTGGLTALSLISTTVFKVASIKLKEQANNNQYFKGLYEYAKSGGKIKSKKAKKTTQNTNSNIKRSNQVTQNTVLRTSNSRVYKTNENSYHLNKNQIIQDEVTYQKKR